MAGIHKRNGKYAVMNNYVDENGKRRQKWEPFKTQAEAMKRKLKLNGGDIKAVQGDSGHTQSKMVTDLYFHIFDDDRRQTRENAPCTGAQTES